MSAWSGEIAPERSVLLEFFPRGNPSTTVRAHTWRATQSGLGGGYTYYGHGSTKRAALKDLKRCIARCKGRS